MVDDTGGTEVQQGAKEHAEPAAMSITAGRNVQPSSEGLREDDLALHEPEPWALKHWRPLMFLVILLVAVIAGVHYRSTASPAAETLKHKVVPPGTLNIYVSGSGAPVRVVVSIWPNSAGQYVAAGATFYVKSASLHPRLKILIISSLQSSSFSPLAFALKPHYRHLYFKEFTLSKIAWFIDTPGPGNEFGFNATFHLPNALQESKGTIFGHLPSVEVANHGPAGYLLAQMTTSGQVKYVYYNPQTSESTAPGAWPPGVSPQGGGPMIWFNVPQNLSISESISGGLPLLRNDQIIYMTPPATLQKANYTWQANGELEPTFEAIDPDAVDARNDASFTSGIAFGIACAAAIALVQELPKDLPTPSRFPPWARTARFTMARRNKPQRKDKPSKSR